MPLVRRRRVSKMKKPMYRKRRQFGGRRPRLVQKKTSQVFSETYKCGTECAGVNAQGEVFLPASTAGQGIKLLTQLSILPQIAQQTNLQSSYKILRAKYTIIPKWTGEKYNEAALGTAAAVGITETPKFAYAINDYDQNTNAPLTELDVLKDNGCRIRMFTRPVNITVRPKPLLEQTSLTVPGIPLVNVYPTGKSNPWIEFDGAGANVQHIGVDGQFTAGNSLPTGFLALADVQCTVSFICKDPR